MQNLQIRMGSLPTGFFKTHIREDPGCRLHGQLGRCTRPAQPLLPTPPIPAAAESPPEATLDQKTQFATPRGLHLLFAPQAPDRWISRKVEPCEGGGYKDNQTGEMLSQEDEANFMRNQQRLCDRYRAGEMADRLVQIVDRYMQKVADEDRAYVMRYPNQVKTMLKKAWKIRKRIRANQNQERRTARRKRAGGRDPEHGGGKACRAWEKREGRGHRTEMAPLDGWQTNPMSPRGSRQREALGRAQPWRGPENPTRTTEGKPGEDSREPGSQPQLASAPSASAHGKTAERADSTRSSPDEE